jgi:hypothetical protein
MTENYHVYESIDIVSRWILKFTTSRIPVELLIDPDLTLRRTLVV